MKRLAFIVLSLGIVQAVSGQTVAEQERLKIEADVESSNLRLKATQACSTSPISCPYSATDTLTTSSCIHQYNDPTLDSYVNLYSFQISAGQTITAIMSSSAFDPYMILRNASNNTVAFDERLSNDTVRIIYTAASTGTYTLYAEALYPISSGQPDTGNYNLDVTGCAGGSPPPACGSATTLCLNNNRFVITADWRKMSGETGHGNPVALTSDTGYFWFFNSANVEMVIKVLNACAVNSHFWVFAGGLTNVEVTIHVTDTQTGAAKTYTNPLGVAFQPIQDTSAFTCP
jgi:hypothetical protein